MTSVFFNCLSRPLLILCQLVHTYLLPTDPLAGVFNALKLRCSPEVLLSHSPPTYVLEFSHARFQLVQTLISTFLS